MESFLNVINGINAEIVEAEQNADKLIAVGLRIEYIIWHLFWPMDCALKRLAVKNKIIQGLLCASHCHMPVWLVANVIVGRHLTETQMQPSCEQRENIFFTILPFGQLSHIP